MVGGGSKAVVWQQENWLNTWDVGMGDGPAEIMGGWGGEVEEPILWLL